MHAKRIEGHMDLSWVIIKIYGFLFPAVIALIKFPDIPVPAGSGE